MKKIKINGKDYNVIENYKDALNVDNLDEMVTEYFNDFDYILGDWSYGKLRLKGFCNKQNKLHNNLNSYSNIKEYIKKYCSFECSYFIIEQIPDNLTNK